MTIIQIELTNACPNRCSNCTRLCGHYEKPFFLNHEDFIQAVKSLEGFEGMAGLMGGEPTLHPQFEKYAHYLLENFGTKEVLTRGRQPIADFNEYISNELLKTRKRGRCLCSSLGKGYYKYFEIIQETFHYQLLNDHQHSGLHQGILISRRDLGIPDSKWVSLRDACWLQNNWSASITPKGAFFCEIAATLDILFDGPGGWPVEQGWWKRKPEDFGRQLDWCEMCGIAIKGPQTQASDGRDDISPSLLEKLKKMKSPKIAAGKYKLFNPLDFNIESSEYTPGKPFYLPKGDKQKRFHPTNKSVFPRQISGIVFCDSENDFNSEQIKLLKDAFDSMLLVFTVYPSSNIIQFLELIDTKYIVTQKLALRAIIKKAADLLKASDWVVLFDAQTIFSEKLRTALFSTVFNPGCFYTYEPETPSDLPIRSPSMMKFFDFPHPTPHVFSMFNIKARSYRRLNIDSIKSLNDFISLWEIDKIFNYKVDELAKIHELDHLPSQSREVT
jgi:hypothetical protein